MFFVVEPYEHPAIVVRNTKTGKTYEFMVGDEGALVHNATRFDLGDARRAAIAYLARYKSAA